MTQFLNHGRKLKEDSKKNLLNIISNKTVSFVIDNSFSIPDDLKKYNPLLDENKLTINYDKNQVNLKTIINILTKNHIDFKEINTYESDLEDVFLKIIKE